MTTDNNPEILRHVRIKLSNTVVELKIWLSTEGQDYYNQPQTRLGYELSTPERVIFTGEDYGCSPMQSIDSDQCLRALLGFLSLRPGDTDSGYFDGYTCRQMEFVDHCGEELSLWADNYAAMEFDNLDD